MTTALRRGMHCAGASLNVHIHFHVLCLDGVYVETEAKDGTLRFEAAPAALQVAPNILPIAHGDRILGAALYAPLSRVDGATLLRRTFDADVTRCTGCAGRMTVRAVVTDPASIDRLLAALRRARDPPVAA